MPSLRAVLFDLDGTLVRYRGVDFESSWGAIAAAAGVAEASQALLARFLSDRGGYAEWVRRDAALLRGIEVERITRAIFPPPLAEDVRDVVAGLRGRYLLGIVSSGVELVAERVRADLGLDFAVANQLGIEDGRFTGEGRVLVDLWNKADIVRDVVGQHGIDLHEVCYIGDHINDIPVLRMVGLGIAVHAKDPAVAEASAHSVPGFRSIPDLIAAHEAARRCPAEGQPGRR
jgi:phosphoserine phosphatase